LIVTTFELLELHPLALVTVTFSVAFLLPTAKVILRVPIPPVIVAFVAVQA